ncbi:YkgJ family cysteine cluster protein [Agrobacterium tumefaciens]|uniref:YkgJ family cysteine cluster protein n=1 Tax=Agrobacterium tumefaciens TaxID=358 RepID=UPI00157312C1|nr:YkgJ family cysteine cluster protein [Agrobacterium tumefaciens]NTD11702.1 YkgJ family cysteine cluster protein [Agrobacterium tumefaciens]
MTEHRFACTACGACCYGLLPLTVPEALRWADTFPLAMSITPVRPGTRGHMSLRHLGVNVSFGPRRPMSLLVWPISFIPPNMACPKLSPENLCSIHEMKPERCRTMPFLGYKDEDSQKDLLIPRPGWKCDTGTDAPVVYRDNKIVDRSAFSSEREALKTQAPQLQAFVDFLLKYDPPAAARLAKAALAPHVGRVVVGFVSFLRQNRDLDIIDFAQRQRPVLASWAERTARDPKLTHFTNYYQEALADLQRY